MVSIIDDIETIARNHARLFGSPKKPDDSATQNAASEEENFEISDEYLMDLMAAW